MYMHFFVKRPGELTAHCTGPTQVAFCELTDHRDGTFTLHVKPQEAGKHMLNVKYGGEHVPGTHSGCLYFVLKTIYYTFVCILITSTSNVYC